MDQDNLLELKGISKSFGATQALRGVDLAVRRGEVHALVGENGAGKSTLMKILSGAHPADRGTILIEGQPYAIQNPADGRRAGVAMIYQELMLAPDLTVEENIVLGMERTSCGFVRSQRDAISRALDLLGHPTLPLRSKVKTLPIGLQQVVEIARALVFEARVVVMDEPTSSLSAQDAQALFGVVQRLKDSGIAVIYISHFLEEVKQVADRFTVLRDGESVGSGRLADTDLGDIIRLMVGRTLTEMFPHSDHVQGEVLLEVEGARGRTRPDGIDLQLHRGEVLGLAGLVGSGRTETIRALFGLERAVAGTVGFEGGAPRRLAAMTPRSAQASKVSFLSENRKEEGLAVGMSIAANTTLPCVGRYAGLRGWGLLNLRRERRAVEARTKELRIRCRGAGQKLRELSGGNQQKVALARILEQGADILLLDEPTRGIDVGSKVEIYRLVNRLAAEGKGIVFVSSYLPELLGVCDTLAVMHRGRLSAVRPVREWDEHEIMRYATSGVGDS